MGLKLETVTRWIRRLRDERRGAEPAGSPPPPVSLEERRPKELRICPTLMTRMLEQGRPLPPSLLRRPAAGGTVVPFATQAGEEKGGDR